MEDIRAREMGANESNNTRNNNNDDNQAGAVEDDGTVLLHIFAIVPVASFLAVIVSCHGCIPGAVYFDCSFLIVVIVVVPRVVALISTHLPGSYFLHGYWNSWLVRISRALVAVFHLFGWGGSGASPGENFSCG